MRALAFIIGGFFVFFLLLLTTQRSDKRALARVSANFIGLWFVVAAGNLTTASPMRTTACRKSCRSRC